MSGRQQTLLHNKLHNSIIYAVTLALISALGIFARSPRKPRHVQLHMLPGNRMAVDMQSREAASAAAVVMPSPAQRLLQRTESQAISSKWQQVYGFLQAGRSDQQPSRCLLLRQSLHRMPAISMCSHAAFAAGSR